MSLVVPAGYRAFGAVPDDLYRRQRLLARLLPSILVLLALAWLMQTCWGLETDARWRAEREIQQQQLDLARAENARLQEVLTRLARRPERVQALVVEATLEDAILARLNQERAALGRQPLVPDPQLQWLAVWRSNDQAAQRYYSHTSPLGETAATVLAGFGGPNCCQVAELIWICGSAQDCGADTIYETFKASPLHRAAQEDGRYDHFGVGVALDVDGSLLITILVSDHPTVEALSQWPD